MDLLILRADDKYIRIKNDIYELTKIDKASVFPINDIDKVVNYIDNFKPKLPNIKIKKLILTEENFEY